MVAVPADTPVTTPVVAPTVATDVVLLDHVPPLAAAVLLKVRVLPAHTDPVLVIKDAGGAHENNLPESGLIVLLKVHVTEFTPPGVVAAQFVVVVLFMKLVAAGPFNPT